MQPETNATRAAEIADNFAVIFGLRPEKFPSEKQKHEHIVATIAAALDEAERRVREECAKACEALIPGYEDMDDYFALRDAANDCAAAIRALLNPRPAAQPEGER